jgi:excisionase family DNA binding protein
MTSQRLTVQEAAEILGTSVDAVRMRVRRGSLPAEKDSDGRVYVWVDGDASETKPRLDGESDALISAKDETIATLREQLAAERQAHAEARRIIAGLVERIPALEPPSEPPGAPESAVDESERAAEPRSGTGGPQEGGERPPDTAEWPVRGGSLSRPWWRRVLGG